MTRVRRRCVLALPFLAALSGCLGPSKEERDYADALESRAAQLPGVVEASVTLDRDLGRSARVYVHVIGEPDRPVGEVVDTARALSTMLAGETPPDTLRLGKEPGLVQQNDQSRPHRVSLTTSLAENDSRVRDTYDELGRGASEIITGSFIRSTWPEPSPHLLQPIGTRHVVRSTKDPDVAVSLVPGEVIVTLPIAEVAQALGSVSRVGLDFRQGHPTWQCRPRAREADAPELVAAVEEALRILVGTTVQEFEITSPWSVVLSVAGGQVEVDHWSSRAEQETAEPIVTDLVQRVNR